MMTPRALIPKYSIEWSNADGIKWWILSNHINEEKAKTKFQAQVTLGYYTQLRLIKVIDLSIV